MPLSPPGTLFMMLHRKLSFFNNIIHIHLPTRTPYRTPHRDVINLVHIFFFSSAFTFLSIECYIVLYIFGYVLRGSATKISKLNEQPFLWLTHVKKEPSQGQAKRHRYTHTRLILHHHHHHQQ